MKEFFWRDEILQVMYWMSAEGLATEVTPERLQRFLAVPETELQTALNELAGSGLVEAAAGMYRLTGQGRAEGRRRFMDEFEDFLKRGHYECNDPDCDCHAPGSPHCLKRGQAT